LQDQELHLTERETNARAGFVAQQAAALAELRQRKTELEAELQALPAKLSEVHAGWVKDVETLRQRMEREAR
jgi:molecular chaperone GrpE (heat shock protein)